MRAPLALFALIVCTALPQAAAPVFASEAAAVAASAAEDSGFEQRPLTVKQIESFLAAHVAIAAVLGKVPEDKREEPNGEVQAALDKAARDFGFKDYGDLDLVASNLEFLLAGFDPDTKSFIGHAANLKKQIAAVQADSMLRPKQKERRIKALNDALADAPQVQFTANIPLVAKYYDRLSSLFDDGEG